MSKRLRGVFAAVATASTADREVDCAKSIALGHYLLSNGCDGLNVLGTTGEATSFSLEQRRQLMTAYAESPGLSPWLVAWSGQVPLRSATRSR